MGLPEVGELLHNKENNQEKGQRAERKASLQVYSLKYQKSDN